MAYLAEELLASQISSVLLLPDWSLPTPLKRTTLKANFLPLSYLLLTPIFFASIGIKVEVPQMDTMIVLFTVLLVIVAVITKLVGCGLGAKFAECPPASVYKIGCSMICRGEVALIVADKGMALNLLNPVFSGPIVIMIVFCTILTPVLLKVVFKGENRYEGLEQSDLVDTTNSKSSSTLLPTGCWMRKNAATKNKNIDSNRGRGHFLSSSFL